MMLGIEDKDSLRRLLEELKGVAKNGKKEAVVMRMKARAAPPKAPTPAAAPVEKDDEEATEEVEASPDGDAEEMASEETEVSEDAAPEGDAAELLKLLRGLGISK